MTLVGASIGLFLASREPPAYSAGAMLRFAGERRALTGDNEQAPGVNPKTTDPITSILELVRSRTVAGAVVDSLGLMLQSYDPEFSTGRLSQVHVDPRATGDSVQLVFRAQRRHGPPGRPHRYRAVRAGDESRRRAVRRDLAARRSRPPPCTSPRGSPSSTGWSGAWW